MYKKRHKCQESGKKRKEKESFVSGRTETSKETVDKTMVNLVAVLEPKVITLIVLITSIL